MSRYLYGTVGGIPLLKGALLVRDMDGNLPTAASVSPSSGRVYGVSSQSLLKPETVRKFGLHLTPDAEQAKVFGRELAHMILGNFEKPDIVLRILADWYRSTGSDAFSGLQPVALEPLFIKLLTDGGAVVNPQNFLQAAIMAVAKEASKVAGDPYKSDKPPSRQEKLSAAFDAFLTSIKNRKPPDGVSMKGVLAILKAQKASILAAVDGKTQQPSTALAVAEAKKPSPPKKVHHVLFDAGAALGKLVLVRTPDKASNGARIYLVLSNDENEDMHAGFTMTDGIFDFRWGKWVGAPGISTGRHVVHNAVTTAWKRGDFAQVGLAAPPPVPYRKPMKAVPRADGSGWDIMEA